MPKWILPVLRTLTWTGKQFFVGFWCKSNTNIAVKTNMFNPAQKLIVYASKNCKTRLNFFTIFLFLFIKWRVNKKILLPESLHATLTFHFISALLPYWWTLLSFIFRMLGNNKETLKTPVWWIFYCFKDHTETQYVKVVMEISSFELDPSIFSEPNGFFTSFFLLQMIGKWSSRF